MLNLEQYRGITNPVKVTFPDGSYVIGMIDAVEEQNLARGTHEDGIGLVTKMESYLWIGESEMKDIEVIADSRPEELWKIVEPYIMSLTGRLADDAPAEVVEAERELQVLLWGVDLTPCEMTDEDWQDELGEIWMHQDEHADTNESWRQNETDPYFKRSADALVAGLLKEEAEEEQALEQMRLDRIRELHEETDPYFDVFTGRLMDDAPGEVVLAYEQLRWETWDDPVVCPVCGAHQFGGHHTLDACPVCGWINDETQLMDPGYDGGENKVSLNDAREAFSGTRTANLLDLQAKARLEDLTWVHENEWPEMGQDERIAQMIRAMSPREHELAALMDMTAEDYARAYDEERLLLEYMEAFDDKIKPAEERELASEDSGESAAAADAEDAETKGTVLAEDVVALDEAMRKLIENR